MIHIRKGTRLDATGAARLLNEIIAQGGTTALTDSISDAEFWDWVGSDPDKSVWHVAEQDGAILGFQWVGPFEGLPPDALEIGTFVQIGQTGLGIGSKLFDATRKAAKAMGYSWINADIRADNEGGLIYYQSRGFVDYGWIEDYPLNNGYVVDKVRKRFDL
ncbi:MAG: GNAT family N-acetyltransferase [Pseudomonadota bacterium]